MRKLAGVVVLVAILAASLPAGATYGTVFVRDWRNMAACQCLTDVMWIAPGANARLSPDGKMMSYMVWDFRLDDRYGQEDYVGSIGLIVGPTDILLAGRYAWRWIDRYYSEVQDPAPVYWAFPVYDYRWSGDGRYIYYNAITDPKFQGTDWWGVWRVEVATGRVERMPWNDRELLATSPDGRWGIFVRYRKDSYQEIIGPYTFTREDIVAVEFGSGREVILAEQIMVNADISRVSIAFNEQGTKLAVPAFRNVLIYDFDGMNFNLVRTLSPGGIFSAAAWDPHGDYLILQEDTTYLQASRFSTPGAKGVLYWVDTSTWEMGTLWPSNFSQYAPWFVPGTRTLAFNTQLGETLQELPIEIMALGDRLPPWGALWAGRCLCPEDD